MENTIKIERLNAAAAKAAAAKIAIWNVILMM